jgi:tRNA dimethylallyltransferase
VPTVVSDGRCSRSSGRRRRGSPPSRSRSPRRARGGAPTEIVAVDAFTVYRGMDVGTAKPDADDRARVPHHLLDVLDPEEELTVVRFRDLARAAIAEVHAARRDGAARRRLGPVLAGRRRRLAFPPTDAAVRAHRGALRGDAIAAHASSRGSTRSPPRTSVRATCGASCVRSRSSSSPAGASAHGTTRGAATTSVYPTSRSPTSTHRTRSCVPRSRARAQRWSTGAGRRGRAAARRPRSRTAAAAIGYAEAEAVLDGRLAAGGPRAGHRGPDLALRAAPALLVPRRPALRRPRDPPRCSAVGMQRERALRAAGGRRRRERTSGRSRRRASARPGPT